MKCHVTPLIVSGYETKILTLYSAVKPEKQPIFARVAREYLQEE
jgi:hypothetical protein